MTRKDGQLSSFLSIKGPLTESTFRVVRDWDLSLSTRENLINLEATNSIGASSAGWLKQFVQVLKRRFDFDNADKPLIELAKRGWHIDEWRPIQLWHMSRTDELLRSFLMDWLFERREAGIVIITTDSVCEFLRLLTKKHLKSSSAWTDNTYRRVASGLLKTAVEFHLMRGRVSKEFEVYRLPEPSFVYLLHAMMEREHNTRNVIQSADWRLFMMRPSDVEEELLRLHQYGKLRFERAGSFLELTLPCDNTADFVRSMTG